MFALLLALLLSGTVTTFDNPGGLPIGSPQPPTIVAPADNPGGLPIG